jgi:hypothetical protein
LTRQRYIGSLTSSSQILAWPRSGAVDQEGRATPASTIPQAIKDACCEFAKGLLTDEIYANKGNRGVRKVTVASVSVEYNGQAPEREIPDNVFRLIASLLTRYSVDFSGLLLR